MKSWTMPARRGAAGCPVNPKSEIRNPKQAPNSNDKFSKPDQAARPRRLGFEDLLLCSLEFVSDFGFRISDFARRSCQTGGVQQTKMRGHRHRRTGSISIRRPSARAEARHASMTCWVFNAISGHSSLSWPERTWLAKLRNRFVSCAEG